MKKIILGAAVLFLSCFAHSQNGLEGIIVEKYYVANAADAAGSVGTLPVGSVTYRVYADMLPGYKFQALYGVTGHELRFSTSTTFFNNEDRGGKTPEGFTKTQAADNTVMLDSWFSVGGASSDQLGIPKSEDNGVANVVNSNSILANTDPALGIPLTTQDGFISGTPEAVTFVGLTTELNVFHNTSQLGNLFTTTNGSIASLNGSVGPNANNKVLIGQFTTDGTFKFQLNIQIGTPSSGVENYVANNPVGAEISIPSLTLDCSTPVAGVSSVSGNSQVCIGTNPVFTATPNNFGYTYSWAVSSSTMSMISGNGTGTLTTSFSPSFVSGTLSVTPSTVCGTGTTTITALTKDLGVAPTWLSTQTITTTHPSICPISGTATQVTYAIDAATGAGTYTWTVPAGVNIISGQGTNTLVVNYLPGTYSTGDIKVKAGATCGTKVSAEKKYTPAKTKIIAPVITVAGPYGPMPANICAYVNHGEQVTFSVSNTASVTASGATSYTWTIPAAGVNPVGSTTGSSLVVQFVTGFIGGEFKVAGKNGCGLGSFSKGVKIALPKLPVTPLLMTGPKYLCGVSSTITGGGVGADYEVPPVSSTNSYLWSAPTGIDISTGGNTTNKIHVTMNPDVWTGPTGVISCTAVSGCGNSLVARSYTVNKGIESPNYTSISGFNLVCPGTTTQYSVPAVPNATAYTWAVAKTTTLTVVTPSANTANIAWGTKGGDVSVTIDGCGVTGAALVKPSKPLTVKLGKCKMGVFVTDEMLSVYPNPSQVGNNITVSLSGLEGMEGANAIIVMYDMLGRPVYTNQKGYNDADGVEYEINTQGFSPGIYMISVQIGEEVFTQKLMLSAH